MIKLVEEIEFLKKQTIWFNADFNKGKDELNSIKKELEEIRIKHKEEVHEKPSEYK